MFFTALFDENILTYSEEPCKLLLFMYRYIRRKPKQANITENGVRRIFATSAGDLPDSVKKYVLTIKKQLPIIVRKLTDCILTMWQNPGGEHHRPGNQAETEQYARRPSDPYFIPFHETSQSGGNDRE